MKGFEREALKTKIRVRFVLILLLLLRSSISEKILLLRRTGR